MGREIVYLTFCRKRRRFAFDFKRIDSTLEDAAQEIYVESFALSHLVNSYISWILFIELGKT